MMLHKNQYLLLLAGSEAGGAGVTRFCRAGPATSGSRPGLSVASLAGVSQFCRGDLTTSGG